jgi:Ca2+-binding RTX toxin-like protein
LYGGAGNDVIDIVTTISGIVSGGPVSGGDGDDVVRLGHGADAIGNLFGGAGTHTLRMRFQNDLSGGNIIGFEILDLNRSGSTSATAAQYDAFVSIVGGGSIRLVATGAATTLDLADELASPTGDNAIFAIGSSDREVILAGDSSDIIYGGGGNDSLYGRLGDDRFRGDEGSDSIYGGGGTDTIEGGAGDDGAGLGILKGEDGDDTISGQDGSDRLDGGIGNDRLTGGLGNDVLVGGADSDTFVFADDLEGIDRIEDWTAADDQLEIDASAFGGGLAAGPLAANRLVVGAAPIGAAPEPTEAFGQFLYNTTTGLLWWDADGSGSGAALGITRLYNGGVAVGTLAVGDFDIVA